MSQQVDVPFKGFKASAAIAIYKRVAIASDKTISEAGINVKEIGISQSAAFAAGDIVQVKLRTGDGTCKMTASGAITAGVPIASAAVGKISATVASTSYIIGTALETSTADGDIIECLYGATATITA